MKLFYTHKKVRLKQGLTNRKKSVQFEGNEILMAKQTMNFLIMWVSLFWVSMSATMISDTNTLFLKVTYTKI